MSVILFYSGERWLGGLRGGVPSEFRFRWPGPGWGGEGILFGNFCCLLPYETKVTR